MKFSNLVFFGLLAVVLTFGYRMTSVSKSVPIGSLAISAETAAPASAVEKLSGTTLIACVMSGNFPNSVMSGNFPNSIMSGNFPNSVMSGNFPGFKEAMDASGALPLPKVAAR